MYRDLNAFIAALDRERELARIADPVSPIPEISAVADRVSRSPRGGPGLLFERPTGFDMPVAVNLFSRPWPKKLSTTEAAAATAEAQWQNIRKGWRA